MGRRKRGYGGGSGVGGGGGGGGRIGVVREKWGWEGVVGGSAEVDSNGGVEEGPRKKGGKGGGGRRAEEVREGEVEGRGGSGGIGQSFQVELENGGRGRSGTRKPSGGGREGETLIEVGASRVGK